MLAIAVTKKNRIQWAELNALNLSLHTSARSSWLFQLLRDVYELFQNTVLILLYMSSHHEKKVTKIS